MRLFLSRGMSVLLLLAGYVCVRKLGVRRSERERKTRCVKKQERKSKGDVGTKAEQKTVAMQVSRERLESET